MQKSATEPKTNNIIQAVSKIKREIPHAIFKFLQAEGSLFESLYVGGDEGG